jgi:hypothetical protein
VRLLSLEETARAHRAADKACGRSWICACAACRQSRARARGRPGAIIGRMAKDPTANNELERAIVGALRDQIQAHGPITPQWIGSAAKRVLGNIANAKSTGLARALGSRRWKGTTAEERAAITGSGGRTAWAGVSPEERTAEMKRRAAVRSAKRKAAGER